MPRQARGRDLGSPGGPCHAPRARPPLRAQTPPAIPPSQASHRQLRPSHPAQGPPGSLEGGLPHGSTKLPRSEPSASSFASDPGSIPTPIFICAS
jgi:hypothetical protein